MALSDRVYTLVVTPGNTTGTKYDCTSFGFPAGSARFNYIKIIGLSTSTDHIFISDANQSSQHYIEITTSVNSEGFDCDKIMEAFYLKTTTSGITVGLLVNLVDLPDYSNSTGK